jgi:hypothetical protein
MNSLNQYNKKCIHGDKIKNNLQYGGNLVNEEQIKNVTITHVVFHGQMASESHKDTYINLPKNIFLMMPICCGFAVYTSLDENQYFDDSEPNVIIKTNSNANNVLPFGKKNY